MFLCSVLLVITISVVVKTEYYTKENATATFNFFKEKYHKKYRPADQKEAFENFVSNLNKVAVLNMNPKEKNIMYTLNKYADLNPSEIQEHFALNLTAYDAHEVYKGPILRNRHILRNIIEPTPEGANLDSMELYDLDDAENLFREYTKAFGKNITKKYDRTVHFYKFVKSLVDANRDHYKGNKNKTLDENADVVEHSNDYYY